MQMQFVNRSAVRQSFTRAATQPRTRWSFNQLTMRCVPPMFPPSIWSVPPATVDSDPRTNNVCEGWNNKFFTLVGSAHPSIWTCIQWFQREHASYTARRHWHPTNRESTRSKCCYRNDYRTCVMTASLVERQ